jgi:tRNA(fMet)-specific endonuclease VapC
MKAHSPSEFYLSIVTFHEQVLGWNTYLSRAKDRAGVVRGYARLQKLFDYYADAEVLPFDERAAEEFDALRNARIRVATMDLRIAAIAQSRDLTVLTRNLVDFQKVPGLKVEDWIGT